MTASADESLRAVAAFALPGTLHDMPHEPLPAGVWPSFLARVRRDNLTGQLAAAVAAEAMPVTDDQCAEVTAVHRESMHNCLLLERLLISTVRSLGEHGIDYRVLKGAAYAHLDYPDPACRAFGDLDLLVRSEQFDLAASLLAGEGYRRHFPEPRRGFDRRFNKGATFTTGDGFELDVHRTLALGPFGLRIRLDRLWADPDPFTVGGTPVLSMPLEQRALNACFSVGIDAAPRLMGMRDIAEFLLHAPMDRDLFMTLVDECGAAPVVARAIYLTWRDLAIADVTALSAWARRYRIEERARRDLALYTYPGVSTTAQSLASVRAIPRLRDKASFLAALVFPGEDFVRGRGSMHTRLRRGLKDLRRATESA